MDPVRDETPWPRIIADLEARIALLESNADDVITKLFDRAELNGRVEALALVAKLGDEVNQ